jgi:signal transduction histidine kinase
MFKPISVVGHRSRWRSTSRSTSRKIYTDDKKLSQILRNFISNALKFTPDGEVRVTARGPTATR